MAFKNRKKNYPLYQTTKFDNIRTMIENVASDSDIDAIFN